jgi:hypothetical protein
MIKEVFKDIAFVEDIRDNKVEIKMYKGLPLEELHKGELNKLFNSQKHQLTKGDRVFIMPGCNIPRFKLSSLKESLGIAISKTASNANIIIYSDDTIKEYVHEEYCSQNCSKDFFINFLGTGYSVDNIQEDIRDVLHKDNVLNSVIVPNWSNWRKMSSTYSDSIRIWKADPEMLDELDNILTNGKVLMHQNDLLSMLNSAVHMTEDMYKEARKMFASSDANNHVLAMELMANCDYDKSCVYLLKLLCDYSNTISYRREKNHVNFKSLCNYFDHKAGYRLTLDLIIEKLKEKKLLTNDRLDILMSVTMDEIREDLSSTTDFFDVKVIAPNDKLIKAIEDVEKVLSGEAPESILQDKDDDDNDNNDIDF